MTPALRIALHRALYAADLARRVELDFELGLNLCYDVQALNLLAHGHAGRLAIDVSPALRGVRLPPGWN